MSKKVVNNPGELTEVALDNPDKKEQSNGPRKNPQKVIAGLKGYNTKLKNELEQTKKKLSKQTNEDSTMSSRTNPSDVYEEGKNMVVKSVFVVGGSYAAAKLIGFLTERYGDKLSENMQTAVSVGVPIVGGSTLAAYGKGSKIAQDAATGMVISGVSTGVGKAFDAVMPSQGGQEMADSFGYNHKSELSDISPNAVIVEEDGTVYDMQGNRRGNIQEAMIESPDSDGSNQAALDDGLSEPELPMGSEFAGSGFGPQNGDSYAA